MPPFLKSDSFPYCLHRSHGHSERTVSFSQHVSASVRSGLGGSDLLKICGLTFSRAVPVEAVLRGRREVGGSQYDFVSTLLEEAFV